jgi:preprotein translocase subunit SecE
VARQTRAQRRARREARADQPQQGAQPHAGRERTTVPERRPAPAAVHSQREHHGRFRFIRESWGELHKVEWPTQNQLIQGTVVVLVACVIVGVYLWGADQVFRRLVQQVFLGQ